MKKLTKICPYCLEAIESRGEKVIIHDHDWSYDEEIICEFCDEETDEFYLVEFK